MTDTGFSVIPGALREAPVGAMNMVELARWATQQCNAIANDDDDPNHYYPLVRAHYLIQAPGYVERDREEKMCFLNAILVE